MKKVLDNLNVKKALIVLDTADQNVILSARNLQDVKTLPAETINVYDVLKYNTVVATEAAIKKIEEVYA